MDAQALLSAQGWRGAGHSLHKTDDTIGLAKPLLLNRKDNKKGLGQKSHFTSDQWWMNAFDEQLKGLETSKDGQVVQTITTGKLNSIEKGSLGKWALYTSFVKGGFLEGTVSVNADEETSDDPEDDQGDANKYSMANLAKTKLELATGEKETKEEREARRDEKRRLKAEPAARRDKKAAKSSKGPKKVNKETPESSKVSRKEEKRARRARKEEKRRKRAANEGKATND